MARLDLNVLVDVKGQEKLSGLGAGLSRTGANLTKFVTLPLLGVGAASTAMALEAEKSSAKLTAAFRNMGKTSGKTLTQLQDQADELGQLTVFDDEQIMEAQAALLSFGAVSGDAFDRALQGALDYAAATGTDAVTASLQFGKALADPEKGLARLARSGIIFTKQQEEQVKALVASGDTLGAQEIILAGIEARYRNTNEVLANTPAGEAAQAFEDLQNAGEELGAVFLPILASLAQGLSGLAKWFTSLPAPMQGFVATFAVVLAAIGPAAFVIGKLIGAFKAVIAVFNLLKIALLTNPFTALALAVAAIAALIILNWDKIWAFLKKTWESIKQALGGLADFFSDTWNSIVLATTLAWSTVINIIKGVINGVIDVINGLFSFLNGISIGVPEINVGPIHVGGGVIDPFNIPLVPHLAEGGIVTAPTLALIGEKGPEAVVPLDRRPVGTLQRIFQLDIQAPLRANDAQDIAEYIDRIERLEAAMDWEAGQA